MNDEGVAISTATGASEKPKWRSLAVLRNERNVKVKLTSWCTSVSIKPCTLSQVSDTGSVLNAKRVSAGILKFQKKGPLHSARALRKNFNVNQLPLLFLGCFLLCGHQRILLDVVFSTRQRDSLRFAKLPTLYVVSKQQSCQGLSFHNFAIIREPRFSPAGHCLTHPRWAHRWIRARVQAKQVFRRDGRHRNEESQEIFASFQASR